MRTRVAGILLAFCLGTVGTIQAQVAWDAPLMVPPAAEGGLGIFLIDAAGAGANVGVLGTWRARTGQPRMGLRFGIADRDGDDLAVIAGADFTGTLTRVSPDLPLDIDWIVGLGAGFADWTRISAPFGLSFGHTFVGDGVRITPFLTPRVVLDANIGSDVPSAEEGMRLRFATDLGVEFGFGPNWRIRFGGTFGQRDAVGVGFVF
jgi:hypothetical protein